MTDREKVVTDMKKGMTDRKKGSDRNEQPILSGQFLHGANS